MNELKEWSGVPLAGIDFTYPHKTQCPKCASEGGDRSGDNLHVYGLDDDGRSLGGWCFKCNWGIPSEEFLAEVGRDSVNTVKEIEYMTTEFKMSFWDTIKDDCSLDGKGFRGIPKEVYTKYKVYHEFDENSGDVTKQHYPITKNNEVVGIKTRLIPKGFRSIGETGKNCQLFGTNSFKSSSKRAICIASGECDAMAAYTMFLENSKSRGYDPIPVVSGTIGENCATQLRNNYEWLNSFEKIYLIPDNDEAGKKVIPNLVDALPKGKVYIIELTSEKDSNDMLVKGKQKEFMNKFFEAKLYTPTGIVSSESVYDEIVKRAETDKLPFPPEFEKLNKALAGGIPFGFIVNILAGCVDADTEFFSQNGWKRISDYTDTDLVGQYTKDGELQLVKPIRYIKQPCSSMYHITTNKGVDMMLTPNHNFAYFSTIRSNKVLTTSAQNVVDKLDKGSGFSGKVATTFSYNGCGLDITEGELRLQVAVIADGRIVKEGKNNYTQMRFVKERKYLRLKEMCEKFNLKYLDRGFKECESGCSHYEVIVYPKWSDKKYDNKYYSCRKEQLGIIVDEMKYWDGSITTGVFTTTEKESADFIQFAYSSIGVRSTIKVDKRTHKYKDGYCATVTPSKNKFVGLAGGSSGKRAVAKEVPTSDGYQYCFTVPTSLLVLRRNGKIFVTGNSGIGKSSFLNQVTTYYTKVCNERVGVVTLEADAGAYGENLLSYYCKRKISLIENRDEKIEFLKSDYVKKCAKDLFIREDGTPSFYLLDDRGDFDKLQDKIEELIIGFGVRVILIDVISDVFSGMSLEQVDKWMQWEKNLVKRFNCIIIQVAHVRKAGSGQKSASEGAKLTEEQLIGSGTQYRSAGINLALVRDKNAEDETVRNTTEVYLLKSRDTGITGKIMELYYDIDTHSLDDKDEYFKKKAERTIENFNKSDNVEW